MVSVDQVVSEQENQEQVSQEESSRPSKKEVFSEAMLSFKAEFEKHEHAEERLKLAISFMRESLSQEKTPRFKDFWEAKKMCLPLFKEKINPLVKAECWTQYTTLSSEAKRLKDLLEEQSTFAIEQIELALKAVEEDLLQAPSLMQKLPSIGPAHAGTFLADKWKSYDQKQRSITFYVNLAGRMKELRKEVIETEMRIRHKNRLLKRLSGISDEFLPSKKEQMKLITQEFVKDVQLFTEANFDLANRHLVQTTTHFHLLRESIKEFQFLAKKLALNARAFSETRELLSQCWEILREAEKEKKQELLGQQEQWKQASEEALALIDAFVQQFKEHPAASRDEVSAKVQQTLTDLQSRSLSGSDFKMLRAKLRAAQEEALKPVIEQEQFHVAKQEKQKEQRRQELDLFKEKLYDLVTHMRTHSVQALREAYETFEENKKTLKPDAHEAQKLAELKKELYEALLLKKEEELTTEDTAGLEELLQEWEEFRETTRRAIEQYRKEMGSSGFDFEKAMLFSKQVDLEKSRLDRALQKIIDIEDKLA